MEKQNHKNRFSGLFSDTFQTFLMALAVFLVIYFFIARPFQVSGDSMFPTYKDREYIFTNILGVKLGHVTRGDVIVFKAPIEDDKDFIKRVVGLPGDIVELRDGFVYLNNEKLNESSYLDSSVRTFGGTFLADNVQRKIPEGSLFVLGDNRSASSDSREWGLLKESAVIGKSFFVYWPLGEAHLVRNPIMN